MPLLTPEEQAFEDAHPRGTTGWIQTYTGGQFWPLNPRPSDVSIFDIAHALSHICRYTGHTRSFYSVAQHSVLLSHIVPPEDALWGLLHDASEAYLCDVARPIKPHMGNYRLYERRLEVVIAARFELPLVVPASIKRADLVMLATEQRDLMSPPPIPWNSIAGVEPLPETIVALPPAAAKADFLARFEQLVYLQDKRAAESLRLGGGR